MSKESKPIILTSKERKILKWIEDNYPVTGAYDKSRQKTWRQALESMAKSGIILELEECRQIFHRLSALGYIGFALCSQLTQSDPADPLTACFKTFITGSGIEYLRISAFPYRLKEIGAGLVSAPSAVAILNYSRGTELVTYATDLVIAVGIGLVIGVGWYWVLQTR